MHEKLRSTMTFWDGVRMSYGVILVGGLDSLSSEVDHTVIALITGAKRKVWTLEWKVRVVLPDLDRSHAVWLIGLNGQVCSVTPSGLQDRPGIDVSSRPEKFGRLLGGCCYSEGLLVTGYRNQVAFKAHESDKWQFVDDGLPGKMEHRERVFGLESLAVGHDATWYGVGLRGSIVQRRSNRWQTIDSPTNARLVDVSCSPSGAIYACGQFGSVLRSDAGQWSVLTEIEDQPFLWDVECLGDQVFAASSTILYQSNGGSDFIPVPFDEHDLGDTGIPTSFRRLSPFLGGVLSVGDKDLLEYSDGIWHRLI